MASRLKLHNIFRSIIESDHVYFQSPEKYKMMFPCIKYELDDIDIKYANNIPYKSTKKYKVTVIDYDPDSLFPDKVGALPMTSFDRPYKADNLNHWVYTIYF